MKLYVASSNAGKLRDFASAAGAEVELEPLPGLKEIPPPPEDEPTFEGNARAKAVYYSERAAGLLVVADDSGLEVGALGGAPGVRSARYAEDAGFAVEEADLDGRNNACLLAALKDIPAGKRQARYRCALAAARDGSVIAVAEGELAGEVLQAPAGEGGFGYDPLFFVTEVGRPMSELDMATRLGFSHRGRALRRLLPLLRETAGA